MKQKRQSEWQGCHCGVDIDYTNCPVGTIFVCPECDRAWELYERTYDEDTTVYRELKISL